MRRLLCSLAVFAVFAGHSWAQDPPVGAVNEVPANAAGDAASVPPALPGSSSTRETLEQRVQRLEAQLEQAQAQAGTTQVEQGSAALAPTPATVVDNSWRYRQHNGTWWYWLPSNRWVYWSNGAWTNYVPGTPIVVAAPAYGVTSGYGYRQPYTTRHHSHYQPSIGVHIGAGYGYGYGHGHGHVGHGHGHVGHGYGHSGHGHGYGGHGHGGHGGGHGHH